MATGNAINDNTAGISVNNGTGTFFGRTITAGNTGVTVTNGDGIAGNPTISVTAGGFPTNDVTTTPQATDVNNRYVTNRGGGVTYSLPATATEGDVIKFVGKSGLATIGWAANQQIVFGNTSATLTTGTLVSTNAGDCLSITCITGGASTIWTVDASIGNWTIT